eukprot:COSAG02_NODE_1894_length_10475_cov_10.204125_5_plen_104_part_00
MFDLTVAGLPPTTAESDGRLSRSAKDAERRRIMMVDGPVDDPCVALTAAVAAAAASTGHYRQFVLLLLLLLLLGCGVWVVMMSAACALHLLVGAVGADGRLAE